MVTTGFEWLASISTNPAKILSIKQTIFVYKYKFSYTRLVMEFSRPVTWNTAKDQEIIWSPSSWQMSQCPQCSPLDWQLKEHRRTRSLAHGPQSSFVKEPRKPVHCTSKESPPKPPSSFLPYTLLVETFQSEFRSDSRSDGARSSFK